MFDRTQLNRAASSLSASGSLASMSCVNTPSLATDRPMAASADSSRSSQTWAAPKSDSMVRSPPSLAGVGAERSRRFIYELYPPSRRCQGHRAARR